MTRVIAILLPILLAGCAARPATVRTVQVRVPVPVPCEYPALPPRPVLPLASLSDDASDADVARATVASLHAMTGYARQLEILLQGDK